MKILTPEALETLHEIAEKTANTELADILESAINKFIPYLHYQWDLYNDDKKWTMKLLEIFHKQFNSIVTLSKQNTLDIKSTNVLIRSSHELFLCFSYLSDGSHFNEEDIESVISFKFLCYMHAGFKDEEKYYKVTPNLPPQLIEQVNRKKEILRNKIRKTFGEIKSHYLYSKCCPAVQSMIKKGKWRISPSKHLSWGDLSEHSLLLSDTAKAAYHILSSYAHSSYHSLELEANYNQDRLAILTHLFTITSLLLLKFIEIEELEYDFYSDVELAIILDCAKIPYLFRGETHENLC